MHRICYLETDGYFRKYLFPLVFRLLTYKIVNSSIHVSLYHQEVVHRIIVGWVGLGPRSRPLRRVYM